MSKKNKKNISVSRSNEKINKKYSRDLSGLLGSFLAVEDIQKISNDIWGVYTEEEAKIVEEWNQKLGQEKALSITVFRDAAFLRKFLSIVPNDEQFKYVENTYKYTFDKECEHKYAILTRRAVPSDEPKPEAFWTKEHRVALSGLRQEIPLGSPQRLHSVIMCTTLDKLEKHGIDDTIAIKSDGQVSIDLDKPFADFLFMYKPEKEKEDLEQYLKKGGKSREEVLAELRVNTDERKRLQSRKSVQELGKESLTEQKDTTLLDQIESAQSKQEIAITKEDVQK
ncbi:hypothetical protein [Thomasclavelia cocleata]|uniref:hypothetical protein n=1 Tax=Thomasclavelia cocleata TaxID=69824 RepID=UPI00272DEC42|nr:hypothetical protein [Thomasclavelia cocleata]